VLVPETPNAKKAVPRADPVSLPPHTAIAVDESDEDSDAETVAAAQREGMTSTNDMVIRV